ncbi:MAG: hypothetical protein J7605_02775 [Variovorax sp.]|nr:hypothetical protein [Variovorax sp.]
MSTSAALLQPRQLAHQPVQLAYVRPEVRNLLHAIGLVFQAAASGRSIAATTALRERSGEDSALTRDLVAILTTRAVQSPATTSNPAWAANLARMTVAAVLDLLAQQGSVAAQLPLVRLDFADSDTLRVPVRANVDTPNLAATFRAEGAPIRVGGVLLNAPQLGPRSLAVIGTASAELVNAAGDDVMDRLLRETIITDTAKALDALFFGDQAGDAVTPPGLASLATGANTAASTGTDSAAIAADLKARLAQLIANRYGSPGTRWAMNTLQAATMAETFMEVQVRNSFLNIPIVAGPSVPSDTVFLIDCGGVVVAQDAPVFESTTEALLHEEADPAAVAPIVDDAGAEAAPVRSLFQSNISALKMTQPTDWLGVAGTVQTVTGIGW